MSKNKWIKERDNSTTIVWRNKDNTRLTIEAQNLEEQSRLEEDKGQWYVYSALDGKGIPSSPDIVWGKKEAISRISELKKEYEKFGLSTLR